MRRIAFIGLVLGMGLILDGYSVADGTFPGANGRIAYIESLVVGDENSTHYLWTMAPDGSDRQQLGSMISDSPGWSADGTRIAFSAFSEGNFDIWTIHADGSNLVQVTTGVPFAGGPAWSPDGTQIVFVDGTDQLHVVGADGSGLTTITSGSGDWSSPIWSPDGSKIVAIFTVLPEVAYGEVYTLNPDGTGIAQITTNPAAENSPDWSPDGSRIVFGRDGDLFLINADGTGESQLTVEANGVDPTWSPDGQFILYRHDASPSDTQIWIMNADRTNRHEFADLDEPVSDPNWGVATSVGGLVELTATRESSGENTLPPTIVAVALALFVLFGGIVLLRHIRQP